MIPQGRPWWPGVVRLLSFSATDVDAPSRSRESFLTSEHVVRSTKKRKNKRKGLKRS